MRERLGKEQCSDRDPGALGLLDVENQRNQGDAVADARDSPAQPQPQEDPMP